MKTSAFALWGALLLLAAGAHPPPPPAVYLHEGFDGPGIPAGWTVSAVAGSSAIWRRTTTGTHPPADPFLPPGQAMFNSYDARPGDQARFTSPAVNLSTSANPFLEFHVYGDPEFPQAGDTLCVEVTTGDSVAGPWMPLLAVARASPAASWRTRMVSLLPWAGSAGVRISFRGISGYGNNIFLDEIRIADTAFHDIGLEGLAAPPGPGEVSRGGGDGNVPDPASPALFAVPGSGAVGARVRNHGTFDEPSWGIAWSVDGDDQNPVQGSRTLSRGGTDTLFLPLPDLLPGSHLVRARTILPWDANPLNDSARIVILVPDTSLILWEGFNDTLFPPPGWSTVNGDGGPLAPWFRGAPASPFPPFEGGGFAADNFLRGNGGLIDDWLISPRIEAPQGTGVQDSLLFRIRSVLHPPPAANYPDSIMLLLSGGGSDTSDFTIRMEYTAVPKGTWTRKAFLLSGLVPPGSPFRVAFRYLHFAGGPGGTGSDFAGLDAVELRRSPATSVLEESGPPSAGVLQAYPNPFNGRTVLRYELPRGGRIRIAVYSVLGREVAVLAEGHEEPGVHFAAWSPTGLASGVYFCRLEGAAARAVRPLFLLR
ncbi:MAG: choice-of-anchor J domain-containing protein [Bacteroidota bacterium]